MTRRQMMSGIAGLALPTAAGASPPACKVPPEVKARLEAAKRGLQQFDRGSAVGADCGLVRMWARRVADAHLALGCPPAERKAVLEEYVRRARHAERVARTGLKAGVIAVAEVLEAEFFRADAEALLAEEEARQADAD